MTIKNIVHLPEPILRKKAKAVTEFNKELQTLIDDMFETMREAPGVGLAAPQIDLPLRLAVVEYLADEEAPEDEDSENPPKKKQYILINPEIVHASEEKVLGVEGCLSIPGILGEVERHEAIQVKGLNRHGKPVKFKVKGWTARIFQHEMDHLDGVLFTDKAVRVWQAKEEEE
ncbi:MAG: peptide deformylase [Anaerolineales bacterium]|nr:peptide deformylase [Anaerolineales bacterium]